MTPLYQDQVAAMFDVTVGTIQRWQKDSEPDPIPVLSIGRGKGIKSEYDPRAVFLWGIRKYGTADVIDVDRERALNLRADTRLKELKEQQMRGELAPVELLTSALGNLASQVSAILETIPGKLKRSLPQLTATDLDVVKREIVKCLNACADIELGIEISDNDSGDSGKEGTGAIQEAGTA